MSKINVKKKKNGIVGGSFPQHRHMVQGVFKKQQQNDTSSRASLVLVSWKTEMFSKVSKL